MTNIAIEILKSIPHENSHEKITTGAIQRNFSIAKPESYDIIFCLNVMVLLGLIKISEVTKPSIIPGLTEKLCYRTDLAEIIIKYQFEKIKL